MIVLKLKIVMPLNRAAIPKLTMIHMCIYVTRRMQNTRSGNHVLHLVSLLPRCTRAPTERHSSPVEAVLTGSGAALPGLIEIPRSPWGTQRY